MRHVLKRPARSVLIIALVAIAFGLIEPSIELAWKCREGFEASEGCVWGKSYMPLSRILGMVIITPVVFAILMLIRWGWPSRTTTTNSFVFLALSGLLTGCTPAKSRTDTVAVSGDSRDSRAADRASMVETQLRSRGLIDESVLSAMTRVPRHRFVPPPYQDMAYADHPLPIGFDQTISQPYIVGYMTETAQVSRADKVLEIGTGSGYQAAILAELAREVYSVEIIPQLADRARALLDTLGYTNVRLRTGDGYAGWKEHAPYDAIVVTAAPEQVPQALVDQLAVGGRMVIPVGSGEQEMRVITKTATGVTQQTTMQVRFVPLIRPTTPR